MAILTKKTDKESKAEKTVTADSGASLKIPSILIQPRISEKAGKMAEMNKYVFLVASQTNKVEVKKAVEAAYKVKVTRVNVIRNEGKVRNFGRTKGKTADFKKAIVTLKKGDKIEGLTDVV
jgi:large subunit ribosomal protein L23